YLPSPYQKRYIFENKETGEKEEYVGKIVGINTETEEKFVYDAKETEPFVGLVFKISVDPHIGQLMFVRVYSGTLSSGSFINNSTKDKRERVGRLLLMHANHSEDITQARAGDIVGVVGFK